MLAAAGLAEGEPERCLRCNTVCETCVDVCPNRANVAVTLADGSVQILHLDALCNECGNCTAFCPYASEPCKDKLTLFPSEAAFADSRNRGFVFLPGGKVRTRLPDGIADHALNDLNALPERVRALILAVGERYAYLI